MMDKIIKTIEAKNQVREKELLRMDESDGEGAAAKGDPKKQEEVIKKKAKQLQKQDAFFQLEEDSDSDRDAKN